MRSIVRFFARKSRGDIAVRETIAEGEVLIAGRGNDCGIRLPDPRVLLHHAEFALRSGVLYVTAATGGDLRVNGNLAESSQLATGQKVRLGPYEITVEPPAGADVVLSVELVQPLDDDLERLLVGARVRRKVLGLGLRSWSWTLAAIVFGSTLIVPLVLNTIFPMQPRLTRALDPFAHPGGEAATALWTSGPVSAAHRFFGASCATCHVNAFSHVKDSACLSCHTGMEQHTGGNFRLAMLTETRCGSCHKEHLGDISIAVDNARFCDSCHADIIKKAQGTAMRNVADFSVSHPEFRPTVIVDPVTMHTDRSRAMSDSPAPRQSIGLKFPHDRHLRDAGIRDGAGQTVRLGCADCHQPDAGGAGLQPVNFERDCHSCHQLKFDAHAPDRELMHGSPDSMFKQVRDIYDAISLRGGYDEPGAPAIVRRRPGTPLTPEQKVAVADWAAAKTTEILQGRFGKGLCGECHELIEPAQDQAAVIAATKTAWTVVPIVLQAPVFPMAHFDHAKHRNTDCHFCHAAKKSATVADVLMPDIKVCRSCHGSEKAVDQVPTTCVVCHYFHRKEVKVIREAVPPVVERKAAMNTPVNAPP